MLVGVGPLYSKHGRSRNVHRALAVYMPIEATDQGDWHTIAIDEPGFGRRDTCGICQIQGKHFALRDRTLVHDTWKLADRQMAVVVDDGAFGAQTAKRCTPAAQISKVGGSFAVAFDRASRGEQHAKFDQGWGRAAVFLEPALKNAAFILKAQRADAAGVIYRKKEVKRIEMLGLRNLSSPPHPLSALGVIAQDDATRPAVGFGIRNRGMKHGTVVNLAMELRTGDKRQSWFDGEAIICREPTSVILERGACPRALRVVPEQPDETGLVANKNLDSPLHVNERTFFVRTRLGRRSRSRAKPISSRPGSIRLPNASPKPRTKSAMA